MMNREVNVVPTGAQVFVGLSGGVDSAVTAALLKETGARVTGVFIKGWYPPALPCTWREDRRDAMRVAAHLQIPFLTLDASNEYKQGVIDYLIREYRTGRTPNPDVMCNREVKFGAFYRFAKSLGVPRIATGHYARTETGRLFRGVDETKDQSYFLWAVPREVLANIFLPLGSMKKDMVRGLAAKYKLPNARKKDSQGICFLGSISVEDFLREEMQPTAGKAVSVEGEGVGFHEGAVLYTLGERVALSSAPPGPWYVVAKDLESNVVTVAHERVTPTAPLEIELVDANWLVETEGKAEAQYRYHGPRITGEYSMQNKTFRPDKSISEPVAPGQSLVLYRGDECLGGGIIN
jgi:tRNA-specific 2-thiouridylase